MAIKDLLSAHCPHCKSIDFRVVGLRNSVEKLISFAFLPFRCGLCGQHFFMIRWLAPSDAG
jgi:hypothetical protein